MYDPPEELAISRPVVSDRGRFREGVDSKNFDAVADGYHAADPGAGETSSTSDQEAVPPPRVRGKRHSVDKSKKRISQVIVDASKRSKRRMTSCTIQ